MPIGQAFALWTLGRAHYDLGDLDHARRHGYRIGEIWALTYLAKAWRLSGHVDTARHLSAQAVAASDNLHDSKVRRDALTEYAELGSMT